MAKLIRISNAMASHRLNFLIAAGYLTEIFVYSTLTPPHHLPILIKIHINAVFIHIIDTLVS